MKEGGVYIHIPFCKSKCLYCDFYSGGARIADWDLYIKCIAEELQRRKEEMNFKPQTLYMGGGTPSLIPPENFKTLIDTVNEILNVREWKEFTIEVNPEDVDEDKCKVWKDSGVNRVSIGIQSFDDSELKRIGRRHDSEVSEKALRTLQKYFNNISADVIYGLPGQTVESYKTSLKKLLAFKPQHLSVYSLMLEPGTSLTQLAKLGKIPLPEEDEWVEMYEITLKLLKQEGYERYEISNYCLPGFESRHNYSYWNGSPYLGLGPGAHSYDGENIRRANPADLKRYITKFGSSQPSQTDSPGVNFYIPEILSKTELQVEFIMTGLRTAKGINLQEFSKKFGAEEMKKLLQKARKHIAADLLKEQKDYLFLTDQGFALSDLVMSDLI